MNQLVDTRAIVTGASRGLGRGVTEAFLAEGASVVAVARDTGPLTELAARDPRLQLVAADASDPAVAARLLRQYPCRRCSASPAPAAAAHMGIVLHELEHRCSNNLPLAA